MQQKAPKLYITLRFYLDVPHKIRLFSHMHLCPCGEMVNTADLKSVAFGLAGSSPAMGTILW
jgi:hypothetical protein